MVLFLVSIEKILLALLPSVYVTKDEAPPSGGAALDRHTLSDIHPSTVPNLDVIIPPPIITRTAATPMASPPSSPRRCDGHVSGNKTRSKEARGRSSLIIDRICTQSHPPLARVHVRHLSFDYNIE